MKKILLVAFAGMLLISSCTKKNSATAYYVKMKINGTWVSWNSAVGSLAPDPGDPSKTNFYIVANDGNQTAAFDVTVTVDGPTVALGQYATDNTSYETAINYLQGIGTPGFTGYTITDAPTMPVSKFTINITSITSTQLAGNIVGNYLYDLDNDEIMTVSEVEFFVRRVQ